MKNILNARIEAWGSLLLFVIGVCFFGGLSDRNSEFLDVAALSVLDWPALLLMSSALVAELWLLKPKQAIRKWWSLLPILLGIAAVGLEAYSAGRGFFNGSFYKPNPTLNTIIGIEFAVLFYFIYSRVTSNQDA